MATENDSGGPSSSADLGAGPSPSSTPKTTYPGLGAIDITSVITLAEPLLQPELTQPFDYLQLIPGNNRDTRQKLLVGLNEAFFGIQNKAILKEVETIIAMLHCASLLVDDIEDDSKLRRGKPCAHLVYGQAHTLNLGNLMYFVAMQRATEVLPLLAAENPAAARAQISEIMVKELFLLHHGQGLDIYWRDNLPALSKGKLPLVEDYMQMIMNKTGGLFRLVVRLLAVFAPELRDAVAFANLLGIIYQIRDDYLNLVDDRYTQMKGFAGEDLVEGKLSLPILYTLSQPESGLSLYLSRPRAERVQPDDIKGAIDTIRECGGLRYTYRLIQEYVETAKGMVSLPSVLSQVLTHMADVVAP